VCFQSQHAVQTVRSSPLLCTSRPPAGASLQNDSRMISGIHCRQRRIPSADPRDPVPHTRSIVSSSPPVCIRQLNDLPGLLGCSTPPSPLRFWFWVVRADCVERCDCGFLVLVNVQRNSIRALFRSYEDLIEVKKSIWLITVHHVIELMPTFLQHRDYLACLASRVCSIHPNLFRGMSARMHSTRAKQMTLLDGPAERFDSWEKLLPAGRICTLWQKILSSG
jgi:hypothetical protein